jgi:hypothetical protein
VKKLFLILKIVSFLFKRSTLKIIKFIYVVMNNFLINLFLKINTVFPHKYHPFDDLKNGISDMNYTDFEYNHCSDLLDQYKDFIDLSDLKGKKILEIGCG